MTVAEMMLGRLGGRAEYADRVSMGPVELIVRDVDEKGQIETVGISLEPELQHRKVPLFMTRRELSAKIRSWLGRYGAHGRAGAAQPPPETDAAPPGKE